MNTLSPRPCGLGGLSGCGSPPPASTSRSHRSKFRLLPFRGRLLVLLGAFAWAGSALQAQWSEDPADATLSLNGTVAYTLVPAEPATCGANSSVCNGPFNFTNVSTSTPQSTNLAYPPCQVDQTISTSWTNKDIWFRLDPAFPDALHRFTLYGAGSPAMTMGGMAVYEAPNASGPFRLLDCSLRGSAAASASNLPSVEAACITAGNKLYLRVWDRAGVNSQFSIGVMGQRTSTMPDRGADETPCTARTVNAVAAFGASATGWNVDYVFACEEPGFLYTTPEKAGGDLWVKLTVPASGNVRLKPSFGTNTPDRIGSGSPEVGSIGTSAYLATDCSDYATFKEVGSTTSLLIPGTSTTGVLDIRCLPAGATLYVRFYSLKEAATGTKIKRFGRMRFEWMVQSAIGTPPANCDPCNATAVSVGTDAWGSACTSPVTGTTYQSCQTPGIPQPACGAEFTGSAGSVWYKFIAPVSGMVVIEAAPGAPPATQPAIALYTTNAMAGDPGEGCMLRMNPVDCDGRQGPGQNARIVRGGLVPGQVYYVRVWSRRTLALNPEGNFTLCISSPPPPAGSCWYMIDLWGQNNTGTLAMEATIPPAPMATYTTSGNDPSESFLVPVPIGSTATFHLVPSGGPIGTTGYILWALWQVNNADTIWWDDGGFAVAGPSAGPNDSYTLTDACNDRQRPSTDCFGMETICLTISGETNTHYTSTLDNRWPANAYSPGATEYLGYSFRPHKGTQYDLAGANMGCLDGEALGVEWRVFHADADGTVAFLLDGHQVLPTAGQADFDFAVWDLGLLNFQGTLPDSINGDEVCPPQSDPIRCSSARKAATTGLVPGFAPVQQEGHGGWGWLEPLPIQNGHGYLVAITPGQAVGRFNFSLDWTVYKNALGVDDPSIISCDPLLLPVELLFLAGLQRGREVDLTWATATERQSSHFIVERSQDGLSFLPIGRVEASGNTQFRTDYAFTDTDPLQGLNYYRLRVVDLDGNTDHSNVVVVGFTSGQGQLMVYPNPVRDQLQVYFSTAGENNLTVQVLDALGRTVQQQHLLPGNGRQQVEVDTRQLVRAAYLVRLLGSSGEVLGTARFVRE